MRDLDIGRVARAIRRRKRWRQEDCAQRANVHRSTWSLLERGHLEQMSLAMVRRCLAVLEIRLDLLPRWRGANLDRLLDEGHAALQAFWVRRLTSWGWLVLPEVSFNHYGERGRIDILAWWPALRILLVVEIKTELVDAQALLGSLDVKRRIGPIVAQELGWSEPRHVVAAIFMSRTSTNRDRINRIAPLFVGYELRGRAATSWLRAPDALATGLLLLTDAQSRGANRRPSTAPDRVRVAPPSLPADQPHFARDADGGSATTG